MQGEGISSMSENPVEDTASRTTSYSYEALKDDQSAHPIRLLRLFPASTFDADIKCELFNTTLDAKDRVSFEALSYTWGDVNSTSPIILHGNLHLITKTLKLALRHLRYPERERILWVDALCINQSNNSEKSQQVLQMRHVYCGGAQRVVVWLGWIPNARRAMDFCAHMHMCQTKQSEFVAKRARTYRKPTKDGMEWVWEKNEEYKVETNVEKCLWEPPVVVLCGVSAGTDGCLCS
jgi:hypothetical protein